MNRKIADSKKRWYTNFFTLKEGFKIVQEKNMLYRIYILNETDIFVEN